MVEQFIPNSRHCLTARIEHMARDKNPDAIPEDTHIIEYTDQQCPFLSSDGTGCEVTDPKLHLKKGFGFVAVYSAAKCDLKIDDPQAYTKEANGTLSDRVKRAVRNR